MLFNSATFIFFLIVVFIIYWTVAPQKQTLKNTILLISSYVFYGWWDWRFLILIAFSSGSDFVIGRVMYQTKIKSRQKLLLLLSLFLNLGILFVFKYFNFFIDSFLALTGNAETVGWNSLNIILPVGISFYTFQTLSYTLDIYLGKLKPTTNALTFFTFVSFFPQLVAGPIERAKNLIPQFEKQSNFSYGKAASGLKLMLWGFFKKMVIADQLASWVNLVYGQPENYSGVIILITTFAFGYQIYCDFSGYSDIAIGTARLFGIDLMINFQNPYLATSFRNFWQRWHISLSTWFRDYVFIPLGGSRVNKINWTRNILITFIISGLWHGANITFVLWGIIHSLLYITEKIFLNRIILQPKIKNIGGWFLTFTFVNLCWLFFRAENATQLHFIFNKIAAFEPFVFDDFISMFLSNKVLTGTGRMLVFAFPFFLIVDFLSYLFPFESLLQQSPRIVRWTFYYLILFMILFFGVFESAPEFIYFQF